MFVHYCTYLLNCRVKKRKIGGFLSIIGMLSSQGRIQKIFEGSSFGGRAAKRLGA